MSESYCEITEASRLVFDAKSPEFFKAKKEYDSYALKETLMKNMNSHF